MIRFLDLTGQIYDAEDGKLFAWFDTVIDQFLTFNYSQTWDNWAEFEHDYREDEKQVVFTGTGGGYSKPIERFKKLYPDDWPKDNLDDGTADKTDGSEDDGIH